MYVLDIPIALRRSSLERVNGSVLSVKLEPRFVFKRSKSCGCLCDAMDTVQVQSSHTL